MNSGLQTLALTCLLCLDAQSANMPLSTVAEARAVSDEACKTARSFDLTGERLSTDDLYWFFHDSTGNLEIHNQCPPPAPIARGSIVRVKGETFLDRNGTRTFQASSIELVAHGQPPIPVPANATDIQAGRLDFRYVRLNGVISSVVRDEVDNNFCWATLRTSSGIVFLTFNSHRHDLRTLEDLADAEITVLGIVAPIVGLRHNLGRNIRIDETDAIVVNKRPPVSPLDAPPFTYVSIPHRQRIDGVVLATEQRRFLLKGFGRVFPVYPSSATASTCVSPGDSVSVSGFTTEIAYRFQLYNALVLKKGTSTNNVDPIIHRTITSLFSKNGLDKIDSHADGKFIAVEGLAKSSSTPDELLVSDGAHSISLHISTLKMLGIPIPPEDSQVLAKGLCLTEFESQSVHSIYPTFKRFTLVPRNAADFTILKTPPWWTPFRLTLLVIVLAAVLLGSGVWNFTLKRKSEKRGKELYDEKIDHALAEQKVEERTRLAVELHDSLSQTLTGVALQLEGGETETAKKMLAACRGELRRCLWDLRSRTFEEKDLTEAIERTLQPHAVGAEIAVRFNVPRERLSESTTHAVLRIVRELVVNAIRHGHAKHVKVAGERHDAVLSFSVTDDGTGFIPDKAPGPEEGHFGLLGVRERIEEFNGELKVTSTPGAGSRFVVVLRTEDNADERQA